MLSGALWNKKELICKVLPRVSPFSATSLFAKLNIVLYYLSLKFIIFQTVLRFASKHSALVQNYA